MFHLSSFVKSFLQQMLRQLLSFSRCCAVVKSEPLKVFAPQAVPQAMPRCHRNQTLTKGRRYFVSWDLWKDVFRHWKRSTFCSNGCHQCHHLHILSVPSLTHTDSLSGHCKTGNCPKAKCNCFLLNLSHRQDLSRVPSPKMWDENKSLFCKASDPAQKGRLKWVVHIWCMEPLHDINTVSPFSKLHYILT